MASSLRPLLSSEYFPFGTQYYRAPSPDPAAWEGDLHAIAAAGMNTVKFWIQWRWNNPAEGEFRFDDIDRLMDIAGREGLRVMLNTIVDVAPAWLYRRYRDASMRTLNGRAVGPQTQPHRQIGGLGLCYNHPQGEQHMLEFLRASVRRFREHPALELWNVASEPELTSSMAELRLYADDAGQMRDMLCYCDNCTARFRAWLKDKYGDIGELNSRWNRTYASFDEAEVPVTRNTFNDLIDWRMFFVATIGRSVRLRFDAVREEDQGRHPLMCHHVFIQGFPVTSTANDPWNVGGLGDLHGITQMDDPMMCDVLRSCARGKPVISAEMLMQYGYTLDLPKPAGMNDVMRYVFSGVAANMKGFIFWQYRPETLGREAPAWGLTYPDGTSTALLEQYAAVGKVLRKNCAFLLDAVPPPAEVAILYSPENQVFGWAATGSEKTVTDSLLGMHESLHRANFVVDFLHPSDLGEGVPARYRTIILPFPYVLGENVARALSRWVEAGGLLIAEAYCGGWNIEKGAHQTTIPGYGLHAVFQARQRRVSPAGPDGIVRMTLAQDLGALPAGSIVQGTLVQEGLSPEGAEVLARFDSGDAAITLAQYGRGKAILVGSFVALWFRRGHDAASGALYPALIDVAVPARRPACEGEGSLRIDSLRAEGDARMLIVRNLEARACTATIRVPDFPSVPLVEQFSGEVMRPAAAADGITLPVAVDPLGVRVYRNAPGT